jgi:hypothetical protein
VPPRFRSIFWRASKTISFNRMSLRKYIFPRALALRLPTVPSRCYVRPELLVHYHLARSFGPVHTKRRRHLTIPAPLCAPSNAPISHRLCSNCLTAYRLCNLYDPSFDSVGSRRRRGCPLSRTGHPETRGRRRGGRQKIISTQCGHQT